LIDFLLLRHKDTTIFW